MASRNFTPLPLVDLHYQGDQVDSLIVIRRTNSARDVREGMTTLAYAMANSPPHWRGVCVVVTAKLSRSRLEEEIESFRSVLHPDIARRVGLLSEHGDGVIEGATANTSQGLLETIQAAIARDQATSSARVTRQQVKAALVERRLWGLPALTMADVRRQMGASHQTIAAAIDDLKKLRLVDDLVDGPVVLRQVQDWMLIKLAAEHADARKSVVFSDPAGHARAPAAMAERLKGLVEGGRAFNAVIGGVIGAAHYYPALDITAAPRLDICLFSADTRFVRSLDAGLVEAGRGAGRKPALVLHIQRDSRPPEMAANPMMAGRLDCLADLLDIGLEAEANEFAQALAKATQQTS